MKLVQKLLFNKYYAFLLYSLPFLFISYFLYNTFYKNENIIKQKVHFVKKEKGIKLFDFVKDLEKKITVTNLEIKKLKIALGTIVMNLEGDFMKSFTVIDYIEKYSPNLNIKRVKFEALSDNKIDLHIEIELSKRKNYYKKQVDHEITNEILYQKSNQRIKKNNDEIVNVQILAIIDDSVFINNKWYKVGNFINNKQIVSIKSDHISLEHKGNIKNIWMYNNEFTR